MTPCDLGTLWTLIVSFLLCEIAVTETPVHQSGHKAEVSCELIHVSYSFHRCCSTNKEDEVQGGSGTCSGPREWPSWGLNRVCLQSLSCNPPLSLSANVRINTHCADKYTHFILNNYNDLLVFFKRLCVSLRAVFSRQQN